MVRHMDHDQLLRITIKAQNEGLFKAKVVLSYEIPATGPDVTGREQPEGSGGRGEGKQSCRHHYHSILTSHRGYFFFLSFFSR
ncbi:hypothetical protein E2C01_050128 [Portunus trituberculatus]|uniref:Uncharacterized protein n=1 Tax=Portunus trituberculatus TaxID=210409 RepID=A0A5B7GFN0_PORTR|nr:hypothetical protein [Portunus trituberculatus]